MLSCSLSINSKNTIDKEYVRDIIILKYGKNKINLGESDIIENIRNYVIINVKNTIKSYEYDGINISNIEIGRPLVVTKSIIYNRIKNKLFNDNYTPIKELRKIHNIIYIIEEATVSSIIDNYLIIENYPFSNVSKFDYIKYAIYLIIQHGYMLNIIF